MSAKTEHKITIQIADIETFQLPVAKSEESFYQMVIEKINDNVNRFHYGVHADSTPVALAKVALYYATLAYRQNDKINAQSEMLHNFEERLNGLLESLE